MDDNEMNCEGHRPISPEDGWELISSKFGWNYDSQGGNPSTYIEYNPCLLLYNRYTGVLRFLFAFSNSDNLYNGLTSARV